jgi:cobalamin biosynthesis protein CbiD
MSIGDVSRLYGLSLRALRFYEERGLLLPLRRGVTRLYDGKTRARLELILKGKQLGFTLTEIRRMIQETEDNSASPGLALAPGEPAINPVPRDMMRKAIADAAAALGGPVDVEIEIAIPGGEKIAERTLNGRLGIVGGLSILGTTGIVTPFSCAAWISSIHRGIDVARAVGADHLAGATGSTSEKALQRHFALPDVALIEMGDFVGGMLKYLRQHPVRRVTVGLSPLVTKMIT